MFKACVKSLNNYIVAMEEYSQDMQQYEASDASPSSTQVETSRQQEELKSAENSLSPDLKLVPDLENNVDKTLNVLPHEEMIGNSGQPKPLTVIKSEPVGENMKIYEMYTADDSSSQQFLWAGIESVFIKEESFSGTQFGASGFENKSGDNVRVEPSEVKSEPRSEDESPSAEGERYSMKNTEFPSSMQQGNTNIVENSDSEGIECISNNLHQKDFHQPRIPSCSTTAASTNDPALIQGPNLEPGKARLSISQSNLKCNNCKKNCNQNELFLDHLQIQIGIKRYLCVTCKKALIHKHNLNQHTSQSGDKQYKCVVFINKLRDKKHVNKHSKVHCGEKPYVCATSNKAFTEIGHLSNHARIHSGEKLHVRGKHRKTFTRNEDLSEYLKIHARMTPYVCAACKKAFLMKSELVRHSKIHTGESRYVCVTCGKSYARKAYLAKHSVIHTGEKRFLCATCGKAFARRSTFTDHTKMHTGNQPFVCATCQKAFSYKSLLVHHIRIHNDKMQGPSGEEKFRMRKRRKQGKRRKNKERAMKS